MLELYEQLTPTKVYHARKTQTNHPNDTLMTILHVLASCSAFAQNKYLERHNAALKVLFWEMLTDLQLSDTVPPWYSPAVPKPIYESPELVSIQLILSYGFQSPSGSTLIMKTSKLYHKLLLVLRYCPFQLNELKLQGLIHC